MPEKLECLIDGDTGCDDVRRLSSAVHSTTLPPLQGFEIYYASDPPPKYPVGAATQIATELIASPLGDGS